MTIPVLTLREALKYNPEDGKFIWRERPIHHFSNDNRWSAAESQARWNKMYSWRPALTQKNCKSGYMTGVVASEGVLAHRIAWAIVMGRHPKDTIDHKNGIRDDNRFINLREATRAEQARNTSSSRGSTSEYLGVSFRVDRGRWRANIRANGKQKHLGYFDNEIDAAKAYDQASLKYFGEFSRLNFPPYV